MIFLFPLTHLLSQRDVKSLFTSTLYNEGIASVKKKYHYTKMIIPAKIITTFLALILTLNNFIFNSKFYLQIKGCAMGTICTPSCAIIFMSEFKKYIYLPSNQKQVGNILMLHRQHFYGMD